MTALPAEVEFGKVVGRFLLAASDGVDVDTEPDAVPGVGTIKFVPLTPNQRVLEPEPVTVTHRGLICNLNSTGYLVDAMASPGVWLTAGAWEVTFSIKNVRISPLTIVVTAAHTALDPLDLAIAIPPEGPPIGVGQYAELSDRIEDIEIGVLAGVGVSTIWSGSQAAYDAITTPDPDTLYFVAG